MSRNVNITNCNEIIDTSSFLKNKKWKTDFKKSKSQIQTLRRNLCTIHIDFSYENKSLLCTKFISAVYCCRKKISSSYEVRKCSFSNNNIYENTIVEKNYHLCTKFKNIILKEIKSTIVDEKKSRFRTKFKIALWKKLNLQLSIEKNLVFVRSSQMQLWKEENLQLSKEISSSYAIRKHSFEKNIIYNCRKKSCLRTKLKNWNLYERETSCRCINSEKCWMRAKKNDWMKFMFVFKHNVI
jgi:hypothetical protein